MNLLGNRIVLVAPKDATASRRDRARLRPWPRSLGDGRLAMANVEPVPAGKYGKAALEKLGVWDGVEGQGRAGRERARGAARWSPAARRRSASSTRPTRPRTRTSRSSAPSRRTPIRRSSIPWRSPKDVDATRDAASVPRLPARARRASRLRAPGLHGAEPAGLWLLRRPQPMLQGWLVTRRVDAVRLSLIVATGRRGREPAVRAARRLSAGAGPLLGQVAPRRPRPPAR